MQDRKMRNQVYFVIWFKKTQSQDERHCIVLLCGNCFVVAVASIRIQLLLKFNYIATAAMLQRKITN